MRKNVIIMLIILLIPTFVYAGGSSDDTVSGMSTHNCYYSGKEDNTEYVINMTLYGVDNTSMPPSVAIDYFTGDAAGNTTSLFKVNNFDGQNYIYNFNKDFGTYFALQNHVNVTWWDNEGSEEQMKEAIKNGAFCPSTVYKVYDKTNDEYMFMFCNGYNSELGQETCTNVSNYINNNKKNFVDDVNNMTVTKYTFVKNYSFSNVGSNDFSNTDIEDTYVDVKNDSENTQTEVDKIISDNAQQTIVDQAGDQGVSDTQLNDYFNNYQREEYNPEALDCNSLLGSTSCPTGKNCESAFYLQIVFDVMKYVAIAIVIIFSILDFTGAVASQDNDAIKKSTKKLIIRLVLCVVIFVLPTILEFVFTLIDVYSPSTCGIN